MFIFFDFDSTVVTKETLDETITLALTNHPDKAQLVTLVEEITTLGMEGRLNFLESLARRLAVVPITHDMVTTVGENMLRHVTPGMQDVFASLKKNGHTTFIVSGGFSECIRPVAALLNVPESRTFTNRFIFANGTAEPDTTSLLYTNDGKGPVLSHLRAQFPGQKFVIVGDGMNDYRAYESGAADTMIGFGANVVRESVREKAPYFARTSEELARILETLAQ